MNGTPILVRGGLVADPASGRVAPLDLLLESGRIARLGAPGSVAADGAAVHDASDRLVLPGFVNAHTHGHANLMKGVADRWTLEASLVNGPWMGGARDPETIYLSTLIGAADMLSKGCTACYDLVYEFPRPTIEGFRAVARAYADAGIRAVLAPMVADQNLFASIPGLLEWLPADLRDEIGGMALGDGRETIEAVEVIAGLKNSLPEGVHLAVAPTIPHHCSEAFLLAIADIGVRHGLPIHMHIAESRLQAVAARKLWGKSPVARLEELGVLRPGFTAAHSVWLGDDELDMLARHGAQIAHIPASNFRLGSGIARVRPMMERGIRVGLATDGANSSDALSMIEAMRLASYGARAIEGAREDWLTAAETVRLATEGSAGVLGLDAGRIAEGALADLVFLDLGSIDFLPLNDPLAQLVAAADSAAVTDVMVGGVFRLRDRRLTSVDLAALRGRVGEAVARLAAGLAPTRALAARLEPHVVAFARSLRDEPVGTEAFIRTRGAAR